MPKNNVRCGDMFVKKYTSISWRYFVAIEPPIVDHNSEAIMVKCFDMDEHDLTYVNVEDMDYIEILA